jgi:2-oxo-3-hexenedioate decarboxylase
MIAEAFQTGELIPPFTDADPTLDLTWAYDVAGKVHALRGARGEKAVGRKIGFTNRERWTAFNVSAPIWGYVYESTVSHAVTNPDVRIGHLLQPRIESEIQLQFARPPSAIDDEEGVLDCVEWVTLGYEIVQCPYPDWRFGLVDAIAAGGLHGALVLGPPVPVSDIADGVARLRGCHVSLSADGVERATGGGAQVLDSPLLAVAALVEVLEGQRDSKPIRSGEIVSTGTLTPPQPLRVGQTWTTRAEGVPLADVSITCVP